MLPILIAASRIAMPKNGNDQRNFWLGSIGIRNDGVSVSAKNGASVFSASVETYHLNPNSHAEGRVLRKLGKHGIVYVARVSRKDHSLAMARPCSMCQIRLRAFNVRKVFYTIDDHHFGIWCPKSGTDKIVEC